MTTLTTFLDDHTLDLDNPRAGLAPETELRSVGSGIINLERYAEIFL